jgi:ABC-type transporter Mla MlaB component
MVTIQKTGASYYLVSVNHNMEELSRTECTHLKHELSQVMKPHREISVNLKGKKSIDPEGFRILQELGHLAEKRNCRIRYINVDHLISAKILTLSEKNIQYHDEFGITG